MNPLILLKSKSKCHVFILCLMVEMKRMLTSIIFTVTSDQVKINRSISNLIKGRRIYRSVRFPINQKYGVKMANQFNTVLYVIQCYQYSLGTKYKNKFYNDILKNTSTLFRILETSLTLIFTAG